jgi:hypothetical protein
MAKKVKPVPDGYHTLTPALVVRGAAEAIEFYKKAFGAEEVDFPKVGGVGVKGVNSERGEHPWAARPTPASSSSRPSA